MLPGARSARSPTLSVVPVIFSAMNASTSVLLALQIEPVGPRHVGVARRRRDRCR